MTSRDIPRQRTYKCEKPDCGKTFTAKVADRRRGWARCCSKACAAWVREKGLDRRNYNEARDYLRVRQRMDEHDIAMTCQEISERGY